MVASNLEIERIESFILKSVVYVIFFNYRLKYFKIRFGYVYKPYRDIFVTDNVYECFEEIRTVALIPGFYSEKALFSFFRNAIQMDSNLVYDRVEPVWSSTRWST